MDQWRRWPFNKFNTIYSKHKKFYVFHIIEDAFKAKKVLWRHQKIWWIYVIYSVLLYHFLEFPYFIWMFLNFPSECLKLSWYKTFVYIIFLFPIYTLMFLFGGNDSQLQGREWRPQELPAQLSELTIYSCAGKRQTVDFVSHSPSPCLWSQKYPWFLHKHHYCSALL